MSDLRERLAAALADRYTIESEVGRGGMAVVFRAADLRHDREVAVKVLRPGFAASIGAERFLREIEIVTGLAHPFILPIFDSGEADGLLYYVMPCLEGESLRDRVEWIRRQEGLKVPKKQPRRGRLWLNDGSCVRLRPTHRGHVWSNDFTMARTHDGRPLRMLAGLFAEHGAPEHQRSDNGPEFTSRVVRRRTATTRARAGS